MLGIIINSWQPHVPPSRCARKRKCKTRSPHNRLMILMILLMMMFLNKRLLRFVLSICHCNISRSLPSSNQTNERFKTPLSAAILYPLTCASTLLYTPPPSKRTINCGGRQQSVNISSKTKALFLISPPENI